MEKRIVTGKGVPTGIGPYSQAVRAGAATLGFLALNLTAATLAATRTHIR